MPCVGSSSTQGIPEHSHVFGLVDRDFQSSNQAAWADLTNSIDVFILPVFEIENYLLDPRALAGCALNTHKREDSDIKLRLRNAARRIAWWTVCCNVISELREDFFADFPEHPSVPAIPGVDQAVDYIIQSAWLKKLAGNAARWTEEVVRKRLIAINTQIQARLNSSDDWLIDVPGKELFRDVQGWIYTRPPGQQHSVADPSIDLAKAVGDWQAKNQCVPENLKVLRQSLRRRVGLSRP
jgi:hypothetical protein